MDYCFTQLRLAGAADIKILSVNIDYDYHPKPWDKRTSKKAPVANDAPELESFFATVLGYLVYIERISVLALKSASMPTLKFKINFPQRIQFLWENTLPPLNLNLLPPQC